VKQRVAIAQALVNKPKVLLMDEPFGALDAQTREEMQELLLFSAQERMATLFVTQDVEEAIYLSTHSVVFSARPGSVVREIRVPFGATRTLDIKLTPEFVRHRRELISVSHQMQPKASTANNCRGNWLKTELRQTKRRSCHNLRVLN
jgi:NitT/TauT family transport system ATP-binding protein